LHVFLAHLWVGEANIFLGFLFMRRVMAVDRWFIINSCFFFFTPFSLFQKKSTFVFFSFYFLILVLMFFTVYFSSFTLLRKFLMFFYLVLKLQLVYIMFSSFTSFHEFVFYKKYFFKMNYFSINKQTICI
jgi:hypothetical protein